MLKTPARFSSLLLAALPFALLSCGGGDDPKDVAPNLVVTPGWDLADSATVQPFDFGNIALLTAKKQVFTVTNLGDASAVIDAAGSSEALRLAAPFSFLTPSDEGTPCSPGLELAPGTGSCTFTIEFKPTAEGSFNDDIELSFSEATPAAGLGKGQTLQPGVARLRLQGKAHLDCDQAPALAEARVRGVNQATQQMQADAVRGTADGKALTHEDGRVDGYNRGYNAGYDTGYNGPNGYTRGYNEGHASGLRRGQGDQASCNRGSTEGYNRGVSDGRDEGRYDGYDDGYPAGYAAGDDDGYDVGASEGYYDGQSTGLYQGANAGDSKGYRDGHEVSYPIGYESGYDIGYFAGADSCTAFESLPGSSFPRNEVPAQYVDACQQQGYAATYSDSAYWSAYNTAKANNTLYQDGVSDGLAEGTPIGARDGTAKGLSDGLAKGDKDGFAVGTSQRYNECYNANYPSGYSNGYASGYATGFDDGSRAGYLDGYDASYAEGYDVAYDRGFDNGYNLAFAGSYDDAYDQGRDAGYDSGYSAGYSIGYSDASDAYCGSIWDKVAPVRVPVTRAQISATLAVSKAKHPPRAYAQGYRPRIKAVPAELSTRKRFGQGQSWWKALETQGKGQNSFQPPKLPEMFEGSLTEQQLEQFLGLRLPNKAGNLRDFVKSQAIESKWRLQRKAPLGMKP